ncbi:hypothetical protein [Planctomycetes bacterium Pan216]|uniref:hypothetical protein n=1 Tax=Kolteria novifilia TaxID=2527975 RepID=UPI0011A323C6
MVWVLGGGSELVRLLAAVFVCLPMLLVTMVLTYIAAPRGPLWQMAASLGAMFARMVFALSATIFLLFLAPEEFRSLSFVAWLVVTYMLTLAVEVAWMLYLFRDARGQLALSTVDER